MAVQAVSQPNLCKKDSDPDPQGDKEPWFWATSKKKTDSLKMAPHASLQAGKKIPFADNLNTFSSSLRGVQFWGVPSRPILATIDSTGQKVGISSPVCKSPKRRLRRECRNEVTKIVWKRTLHRCHFVQHGMLWEEECTKKKQRKKGYGDKKAKGNAHNSQNIQWFPIDSI